MRGWFWLTLAACLVLAPLEIRGQAAAAPSPSASPAEGLSAQRAEGERTKMYQAGLAYSRWLDGVAKNSGREFLPRRVFDRVTWMHLLA